MTTGHIEEPEEMVSIGEKVFCKVISIDVSKHVLQLKFVNIICTLRYDAHSYRNFINVILS